MGNLIFMFISPINTISTFYVSPVQFLENEESTIDFDKKEYDVKGLHFIDGDGLIVCVLIFHIGLVKQSI